MTDAGDEIRVDPVAAWLSFWRSLGPRRAFRFLFVLFLVLHVWKVAHLLPIPILADGAPLVEYHYSQTYVDVVHDRAFRRISHRSWGYDPFTGGGQITGAGLVPESHAAIAFDRLLRPLFRPDTTVKLFTGLALLSGPFFLFAAARLFGLAPSAALVSAALLSAGMLGPDDVSRTLVYRGHVAFWLACCVALFNAAAFHVWIRRPTRRLAAAFVVTWPALLLLDPAVALVQVAPALVIALLRRERRWGAVLWLACAVALALAVNAFWIAPYVRFQGGLTDMSEWPSVGWAGAVALFLPVHGAFVEPLEAAFRGSLLLMSIGGLMLIARERRALAAVLGAWAAAFGAVAFFGSDLPVFHDFEPARLSFAATTLLLLPAGVYLVEHIVLPGTRRILFGGWFLWLLMTWQLANPYDAPALRNTLTPRETRLLADLRRLPPDGRILVQYHPLFTDGLRLASVEKTHAFVGFPGSWWKLRDNSGASFGLYQGQWYMFGAPLRSLTQKRLMLSLAIYDVAYVVTTAPVGNALFSYFDDFVEMPSQGEGAYRIFRVKAHRPGYLLDGGTGTLTFDYDRLWIRGASAGRLTASFHAADGFFTVPPLNVHGVQNNAGGPPLLAIDNPLGRRDIEVRYGGS